APPSAPAAPAADGDGRSPAAVALAAALAWGDVSPAKRGPPPAPLPPPPSPLFDLQLPGARPAAIVRGTIAIADLLDEAMLEGWPVRLAYANKKGRGAQITASVLDVGSTEVV